MCINIYNQYFFQLNKFIHIETQIVVILMKIKSKIYISKILSSLK